LIPILESSGQEKNLSSENVPKMGVNRKKIIKIDMKHLSSTGQSFQDNFNS